MPHAKIMKAKYTHQSYEQDCAKREEWEQEMMQAIQAGRDALKVLQDNTVLLEDVPALRCTVQFGQQCREQLTLSYLPLITIFARRYSYIGSISIEEIIQEGTVNLLQVIDNCNYKTQHMPSIKRIVKQALYHLIQQKNIIHFPNSAAIAIRKVIKVSKCMECALGYSPKAEKIAQEMLIPIGIVRKLLSYIQSSNTYSLDAPAIDDESNLVFGDFIMATDPNAEQLMELEELRAQILDVLKTLEPMEESTIKLRFGFIGGEIFSAEETAQELKISLDEEQRLEIKAMRKLRHPSRSTFLRDYL